MDLVQEKDILSVDLPQLQETFADSVLSVRVQAGIARINLGVTRIGAIEGQMPTGERLPAARLVLPIATFVELRNTLNVIVKQMEDAGTVGRKQTKPPTTKH